MKITITLLNHYKCIDLAMLVCYFYGRNKIGVGDDVNGKYNSSKSR